MPSQKLLELERALTRVYLKIFREIKKDPNYPNDLAQLKVSFETLVYDSTRSAVQQAVIIGIERVNSKLKTEPYLTTKDIEVIEKNTDEQVASFWRKVQIAIKEEQSAVIGGGISDYFKASAISAVFTSVRDAVVSKVGQLVDFFKDTPKVRWETAGDEKVCPICRPLDGREWDYDDDSIPRPGGEPPNETHYNCRCEIIPLV